jgi:hypothetical protein
MSSENVFEANSLGPATSNSSMPTPDSFDQDFIDEANAILKNAAELSRVLVGAHQSAAALVVQGDWSTIRKYFSLSEKYAAWAHYNVPATGYGSHSWMLTQPGIVRLTQTELEAHPQWRNFGRESARHPPMRGWLAGSIRGKDGTSWGLLQLSDKYEGDFDHRDEAAFARLLALTSSALEGHWLTRNVKQARRS